MAAFLSVPATPPLEPSSAGHPPTCATTAAAPPTRGRRRAAAATVAHGIRHNYKLRKEAEARGEDPDLEEDLAQDFPDFPDLVAGAIPNPILAMENGEDILSNLNTGAATAASYYYLQSHRNVDYDFMVPGTRPDPVTIPDDPDAEPIDMLIPECVDPRRGLPPGIDPRQWLVALYGRQRTPRPHENRRLVLKAFIGVKEFHLYAVKNVEGVVAEANSREREIGPYRGSRSIQCVQLLVELLLERLRRAGYQGKVGKDVPLAAKPVVQLGRFVFEGDKVKRGSRQRVKVITETLYKGGMRIGVDVDKWITEHQVRFDRAFYERMFEEYYMTGCADIISNFRLLTPGPKLRQKLKKAARKTFVVRQLRASLGEEVEIDETDDEDDWGGTFASGEDVEDDDRDDEDDDAPEHPDVYRIGTYREEPKSIMPHPAALHPYFDAPSTKAEVAIVDDSEVDSRESLARDFAATFAGEDEDDERIDEFDDSAVASALRDQEMSRTRKLDPSEKFEGAAAFADSVLATRDGESLVTVGSDDDSTRVGDDLSSFFDD